MRRTVVDLRFRDKLVTLMKQQGLSGKVLADKTPMSRSYLSEIINGLKMPLWQVAYKLDKALDAGGQLADLVNITALVDDLDPLAYAAMHPHRSNPEVAGSLARVLSAQRHLEDSVGAAAILGPVLPHLDTVTNLANCTKGDDRPQLLYVAGQWAQYAGWLYTSLGDWGEAQAWNRKALEWATEIHNADLIATVLSYQAHVAWLTQHSGPTVGLAKAALRDPTVYPGQRAYDYFQAAQAYAAQGDIADALHHMDVGSELAAQIDAWGGEVPPWQYYRDPWLWELERGIVFLYADRWEAGHAPEAVARLRAGLDAMPEYMRCSDWAAEYQLHLVAAYIRAGATQTAREVLEDARRVAIGTNSRRVLRLARDRERQLSSIV